MATNTSYDPQNINQFEKAKLNKYAKGVSATITGGTTGYVDITMEDDVLVTGGVLLTSGGVLGDKVDFQVLMGSTVIMEFVQDWYIDPSIITQATPKVSYPAKLTAGLTLRLEYYSTGTENVWVAMNFDMEKVLE